MKHVGPISGISSFAQKYVATAGYDNQILLWNLVTKRAVARAYHDHLVNFCTFSPQGNLLATASSDHTARIYAVPGLKLVAVLSGHDDDVEMVQFHPFKNLLATASRDHKIRIFDFQGTLQKTLTGHVADVLTVVWSSDGEELISTSDDAKILRWSPHNGEVLQEIDMNGVETDTLDNSCGRNHCW
jgi:WD40 repeat protein